MPRIGGVIFLLGLVTLLNGAIFIWRSRMMQRAPLSNAPWSSQVRRYRNTGVFVAIAGVVIVLGSFLIIAQRGF